MHKGPGQVSRDAGGNAPSALRNVRDVANTSRQGSTNPSEFGSVELKEEKMGNEKIHSWCLVTCCLMLRLKPRDRGAGCYQRKAKRWLIGNPGCRGWQRLVKDRPSPPVRANAGAVKRGENHQCHYHLESLGEEDESKAGYHPPGTWLTS